MIHLSDIALQKRKLVYRHVQLVPSQIFEKNESVLEPLQIEPDNSFEDADAVVPVHHGITDIELGERVDKRQPGLHLPPAFLGTKGLICADECNTQ